MCSVEEMEVFIPQQACVVTVPLNSLPSSITKKMSPCPVQCDRPATFISPVELRGKGMSRKTRPLTSGQFFLPVVTSNRKAFSLLRNFLHSGENSMQFSNERSRAGSAFSKRTNSIILFDQQIFLSVRKNKMADWPLKPQSSTPSECEAPPLNSPVKTDGDITDRRRSNDGIGAAEDDGKCAEVLQEREADAIKDREENERQTLMKDKSTNTPRVIKLENEKESGVSAPVDEAQSLLANAVDNESRVMSSLTENSSKQQHANEARLAVENISSVNLKPVDDKNKISKGLSSLAKAKCCKRLHFSKSPLLGGVNKHQVKSDVKVQISELVIPVDKTKASVSANDNDQVSQKKEDEIKDVTVSKSHISFQPSECWTSRSDESAVEIINLNDDDHQVSNTSSDEEKAVETNVSKVENMLEIVEETGSDCDDLIIVEICGGRDMEVSVSSSIDKLTRHISSDEGHVTEINSKTEGPIGKVASSSKAIGCDGAVEFTDVCNVRVLHDVSNDTSSKSRLDAVVDHNNCDDVIINDGEILNIQGRWIGDVAKGKRRVFDRMTFETSSDVAAPPQTQINEINGSAAKRSKRDGDDDTNLSSERKTLEIAGAPKSQVKNDNQDVEIIEVDDDDGDNDVCRSAINSNENVPEVKSCIKVQRNSGNAEDSLDNVSSRNCDVEILDLPGQPGDGVQSQPSWRKPKAVNGCVYYNDRTLWSIEVDDQDDPINKNLFPESHVSEAEGLLTKSDVEIMESHDTDHVLRKNAHDTNSKNDVNKTIIQTKGLISEVQSSSDKNKSHEPVSEIADVLDEDRPKDMNQTVTSCVKSYVSEVQNKSATETVEMSNKQEQASSDKQSLNVLNESYVSKVQRDLGGKSYSAVANQDVQISEVSGEEQGVVPRAMSPRVNQELEYVVLRREENICRIRARLRGIEEKLNTLINSHR